IAPARRNSCRATSISKSAKRKFNLPPLLRSSCSPPNGGLSNSQLLSEWLDYTLLRQIYRSLQSLPASNVFTVRLLISRVGTSEHLFVACEHAPNGRDQTLEFHRGCS